MRGLRRCGLAAALLLACVGSASAQTEFDKPAASDPASAAVTADRARREETLRSLEQRARQSVESRQRLESEIATLRSDRPKLSAALLDAAGRARAAEERARAAEARL
ncbi:MAG: hypothetical protein JWR86_1445, partial [Enterovirga sp.]|nr:hypothetical protein [Enterovirga sp.]